MFSGNTERTSLATPGSTSATAVTVKELRVEMATQQRPLQAPPNARHQRRRAAPSAACRCWAAAHTEREALSLMSLGFQPFRLLLLLAALVLERGLADGILFDALDLRIIKTVENFERQFDGP